MKDPLQEMDGAALYQQVAKLISGAPLNVTRDIAVSILIHSIRQGVTLRKDAEACFDEIMRRGKDILLAHYDSVTGKRRGVFPYTQVIRPPLHVEESKSFDPQ